MYNSIDSFVKDFVHEQKSTLKYFEKIQNQNMETVFHPDIRTVGWLSWHIVVTISEMTNHAGLKVSGPIDNNIQPSKIADIIQQYNISCESALDEIQKNWNDTQLNEEINMYGQTWKKGVVLSALLFHQAHHRGQLSILMRLSELKVPGIIGPSKEEWLTFGMEPQK